MAAHFLRTATAPALVFLSAWMGAAAAESMTFHTRARVPVATGSDRIEVIEKQVQWDPARTALVVCDMWDKHHCPDATERVAEMAPRMNDVLKAARTKGMLIIHCPSDTMEFYKGHPGRKLAQAAPKVETTAPLDGWRAIDGSKEPPLPIDDSDGGCDGSPDSPSYKAWTRQHPALEIMDGDAITDSAEAFHLMRQRGIPNVLIMGVHINMCVLGRPFAIRQMVTQGQNVLLMRDMTDSMYNHRKRPWVSHFRGTELVVEHIEQYWCPSVTSAEFLGGEPFRFKGHVTKKIVLIIGEDEYSTWETLPEFAHKELEWRGYDVSAVQATHIATAPNANTFANFEAIRDADAIVVSVRRRTPQKAMMDLVRAHVAAGKPVVGLRTANHAFQAGPPSADFAAWNDFDTAVLGGHYAGHYNNKPPAAPHSVKSCATWCGWRSTWPIPPAVLPPPCGCRCIGPPTSQPSFQEPCPPWWRLETPHSRCSTSTRSRHWPPSNAPSMVCRKAVEATGASKRPGVRPRPSPTARLHPPWPLWCKSAKPSARGTL